MLAALVAGFGAFGVISAANARSDDVERIEGLELVLTAQDGPAENYLLVGTDSRENADPNAPDFGGIGDTDDVSGRRRHDHDPAPGSRRQRRVAASSLPRDLWVDIVGATGEPDQLGLQRRHRCARGNDQPGAGHPDQPLVEIDFNGFKDIVDAIGGAQVCFVFATRDKNTGLDAAARLPHARRRRRRSQYARSRYYEEFRDGDWQTDPRSDLGRIERQQNFLQQTADTTIDRAAVRPVPRGRS